MIVARTIRQLTATQLHAGLNPVDHSNLRKYKMPSGPPELHEFWSNYYTDWEDERMMKSGDFNASRYLKEQGFTLTRGWEWTHPTHKDYNDLSELEYSAIYYMVHEWDYGGFRLPTPEDSVGPQR